MSKFDEMLGKFESAVKDSGKKSAVNMEQLTAVAKSLGPSIYLKDASLVACTNKAEMDRVKSNFLIKKLGMTDGPELDNAIKEVCAEYDSNHKYRAVFYYMLAQKLGKTL